MTMPRMFSMQLKSLRFIAAWTGSVLLSHVCQAELHSLDLVPSHVEPNQSTWEAKTSNSAAAQRPAFT